ncbi:MAG TPA: pyridoxal phosphate-dependent aminotransferase, partial [Blastocatellia bacterium]|nr:pyridoxal phosphate-dependent aminotransferase [Blastocatellia bacterium]
LFRLTEDTLQAIKRPQPDIRAIARMVPPSGNLVQGQNEIAIHPDLASALNEVVAKGLNSYSFFEGVDELRRAVAEKIRLHNKVTVDPDARPLELIITPGATGGLVTTAHTYLRGASAVVFEPYYPYHKRTLETCDGRAEVVKLRGPNLELDLDELRRVCREGKNRSAYPVKAIIVSSPANPTGRVFTHSELLGIINTAEEFDLLIISDEVYEHFALDQSDHISTASLPGAFDRTITVNSFSKSWAVSGWRLGYMYGPGSLVGKLSALGNIYYVCTPTPLQHALARVLMAEPGFYEKLRSDFARKRDILRRALEQVGFSVYDSRSAFYIWARIPERFDDALGFNDFLMKEAGVAGVPGSAFMDEPEQDLFMRICFAREDSMLEAAAERIVKTLG